MYPNNTKKYLEVTGLAKKNLQYLINSSRDEKEFMFRLAGLYGEVRTLVTNKATHDAFYSK